MRCDKRHMLLYAVTDRTWTGERTLYQQVEDALKGGVTCVQLREKEMEEAAFLQEAKEICALCRRYGVPFIVNDNVDIAIACGADGIHVGQEDMAAGEVRRRAGDGMILGVSAPTVEEAEKAAVIWRFRPPRGGSPGGRPKRCGLPGAGGGFPHQHQDGCEPDAE